MKHEPARVEELPSFTLAGISVVTTNEAELSGNGQIGKLFERYYSSNMGDQLAPYAQRQRQGLYNCYFNYEHGDAGRYEVLVGVPVRELSRYPESVTTYTVPAARYAVFVTERGPIYEVVQRAWGEIWQWSRQPGNNRAFTGDFELYRENTDPNDGQVEIYIALSSSANK